MWPVHKIASPYWSIFPRKKKQMIHDVPHLRHNHKTLNLTITKFEEREKCHMACIWAIEVA
jgi:hypothetical protein